MQRLVAESEQRIQLRMDAQFDAVYQRFDRLDRMAQLRALEERISA